MVAKPLNSQSNWGKSNRRWTLLPASIIISAMEQFSLSDGFSTASEADWLALAAKALGDKPFDNLRTELHDGVTTEPLYTQRVTRAPLFGARGWHAIQPLTGDAGQLNGDIANGAGAIAIDFDAIPRDCHASLAAHLASDISYYIAPGSPIADAAFALAANSNNAIKGSAGFDPLGAAARSGERPAGGSAAWADYADAAFYLRRHQPEFTAFLVAGDVWDSAGGAAIEELGLTLGAAAAYLRMLFNAGMPVEEAARCIGFRLGATADIFLTISKFRALRFLWARALEAAGASLPESVVLLGRMSSRIVTAYDPHVNILRGTAAAFGAAVGGANGIVILPFDAVTGGRTDLARRLARNTSFILQKESYLSAVADPAAGSAYIEALTDELSGKAWALFREVEGNGGLAACLENGFVQDLIARKSAERERDTSCRKDKITGVSVFPDLGEKPAHIPQAAASAPQHSHPFGGKLPELPAPGRGERFAALIAAAANGSPLSQLRLSSRRVPAQFARPLRQPIRDAEPFETLRQRADLAIEKIGSRPPLLLATFGKPEDYRSRASWVQSFFAIGGIEVLVPQQAFDNAEALAEAFRQSPAPIACLCSSNAGYASMPGAAAALKKAGAILVYLAGPASILKTLPQHDNAAIDRLLFEGCNALLILQEAQAALRVQELSLAADEEAKEDGFEVKIHPHAHGDG